MSLRRLLNFASACWVEDLVSLGLTRPDARAAMERTLTEATETPEQRAEREEQESAQRNAAAIGSLMAMAKGAAA